MDNDSLAILQDENVINDEEFVLLYDLESSGNLYLPHIITNMNVLFWTISKMMNA